MVPMLILRLEPLIQLLLLFFLLPSVVKLLQLWGSFRFDPVIVLADGPGRHGSGHGSGHHLVEIGVGVGVGVEFEYDSAWLGSSYASRALLSTGSNGAKSRRTVCLKHRVPNACSATTRD
ncbi:hypothetical protein B0T17DRAFT_404743 [Bombardia bombarda]|uniref:Uncharacterized protein n=1 Tax=Bombardia bombarda TaxID=252184 RepID=A0AA39U5T1_9PEZI|nr:hypothetical protein B0T17DRAFT_404743 [Bombardia bombarda]